MVIPGDIIGSRDTQQHVLIGSTYEEFRVGKDLTKDKNIVKHFEQVIQKRLNNAWLNMSDMLQDRSAAGLSYTDFCQHVVLGPLCWDTP